MGVANLRLTPLWGSHCLSYCFWVSCVFGTSTVCMRVILHMWIFLFVLGLNGVWTQGFDLTKQVLHHSSHTCSPFFSGYLFTYFFLRWGLQAICPGWPQIVTLQISASHLARIIGMYHRASLSSFFETRSPCIAQGGLELKIFLPWSPEC
jgi:hypothetical protein